MNCRIHSGISLASIGLGLSLDGLLGAYGIDIAAQLGEGGELIPQWLAWASGVILVLLAVKPIRRIILR